MTTPAPRSMAPLYWLALGTFATGTEGFMIAPLLPDLARDFSVSLVAAGQLVTVFSLTYALSSPVLTALTGDIDRRRLLIASMLMFAAANFVACAAHGYIALMARASCSRSRPASMSRTPMPWRARSWSRRGGARRCRSSPAASALPSPGACPRRARRRPLRLAGEFRGRRCTGVDCDRRAADRASARHRRPPAGRSLRERLDVAREPALLVALLVTMLWATGAYAVYTYLASFLSRAAGLTGSSIGAVLFMWGVAAVIGLRLGGRLTDRFGQLPVSDEPVAVSAGLPELVDECGALVTGSGARTYPARNYSVGPVGVGVLPGPAGAAHQRRRRECGAGRALA